MASKRRTAATIGEIRSDLNSARQDMASLAEHMAELLSDKSDDVVDDMKQRVGRLRETLDLALSEVGADSMKTIEDAKNEISASLEETMRERPFMMLAIALGLGVVVGTTLLRR